MSNAFLIKSFKLIWSKNELECQNSTNNKRLLSILQTGLFQYFRACLKKPSNQNL